MQLISHGRRGSQAHAPNNDVAQHGGLLGLIPSLLAWFKVCIFDIEHSCYGQLTPVKTRYLLISVVTILQVQV